MDIFKNPRKKGIKSSTLDMGLKTAIIKKAGIFS
jgi:hypothetical protein